MRTNFTEFSVYCSGFKTQKEAEEYRDGSEAWLNSNVDGKTFRITTSVSQGPYGWKAEVKAVKDA